MPPPRHPCSMRQAGHSDCAPAAACPVPPGRRTVPCPHAIACGGDAPRRAWLRLPREPIKRQPKVTDMDGGELSRLQFGRTAMYHFLFVPLTLGRSVLLAIMESIYVTTGRTIWRDMTKFWGLLFGINFAMGVATGLTMEFEFGTNWAYYAHYVGDIFGAPLAIEGLMAFFLEASFIGLFFFGWNRMSRIQHLAATCLMAIGTNLSALWILIANGWMQYPVGACFNL